MRVRSPSVLLVGTVLAVAAAALLLPQRRGAHAQISLPFKLPQNLPASVQGFEQKATEEALGRILDNELPLKLDATTVYPTVSVLPGGPFNPKPLALSAVDSKLPLPPGDYAVPALAFCTEYSVHQPGAGTAYVLAPLQGKAATAISTLLWRGSLEKQIDPRQLQAVSWAIQSGLTYAQMPKSYQGVIDSVIPEYKGQLGGNFLQHVQDTYQAAAKTGHLPPLEKVLGNLGQSGQLALSAMRQQQVLLRQDTTDQLREQTLFRGQESGIYRPVKAEEGPWTVRIPNVAYIRFKVVGGNMAGNNVIEIRILPPNALRTPVPQRTARQVRTGLVPVAYTAQQLPPGYGRDSPPDVIASSSPDPYTLLFGTIAQALGRGAQSLIALFAARNPCSLPKDKVDFYNNMIKDGQCACPPAQWNMCPNGPVPGYTRQQSPLSLRNLTVTTNMCEGRTSNGILMEPKGPPPNGCASMADMHIWQFVSTTPVTGDGTPAPATASSYPSGSCPGVSRTYGQWYLDACPANPKAAGSQLVNGHLEPQQAVNDANGKLLYYLTDDQASGYTDSGAPAQKQFYDFLMCGTQIVDTFTWTINGASTTPQSCKDSHQDTKLVGGNYTALKSVPTNNSDLQQAACAAMKNIKSGDYPQSDVLKAIAQAEGCQTIPQ